MTLLEDLHSEVVKSLLCAYEVEEFESQLGYLVNKCSFAEISGDHRLSYEVCILSSAFSRQLAALLSKTKNIWDNLKYNEKMGR